jgi:hypothetical protein
VTASKTQSALAPPSKRLNEAMEAYWFVPLNVSDGWLLKFVSGAVYVGELLTVRF